MVSVLYDHWIVQHSDQVQGAPEQSSAQIQPTLSVNVSLSQMAAKQSALSTSALEKMCSILVQTSVRTSPVLL